MTPTELNDKAEVREALIQHRRRRRQELRNRNARTDRLRQWDDTGTEVTT